MIAPGRGNAPSSRSKITSRPVGVEGVSSAQSGVMTWAPKASRSAVSSPSEVMKRRPAINIFVARAYARRSTCAWVISINLAD